MCIFELIPKLGYHPSIWWVNQIDIISNFPITELTPYYYIWKFPQHSKNTHKEYNTKIDNVLETEPNPGTPITQAIESKIETSIFQPQTLATPTNWSRAKTKQKNYQKNQSQTKN